MRAREEISLARVYLEINGGWTYATKRADLLKEIRTFAKMSGQPITEVEGANHTRVEVGDKRTVVARHSEINEVTAKAIRQQLGISQPQARKRRRRDNEGDRQGHA